MTEYITREAALMAVCSAELPDKTEDGTPILNGKRKVSDCVRRIKAIPTADVVEVVRCKDCKHWFDNGTDYGSCFQDALVRHRGFFCLLGERREVDV